MIAIEHAKVIVSNPDFIDLDNPSTVDGLNDGLVLHVRFLPSLFNNDTYPDFSPHKNDLTLLNVTDDLVVDLENGRWGYLACDGSSGQSGYCPLSDSLELTELTFSGWVSLTDDSILSILEKREGTTSAWCIYANGRVINIAGSDRSNNVAVTGTLTESTWRYITVTLDSSGNAKGYVNGVLSLSATTDAPGSQPTFPVILGARWDNIGTLSIIRPFNGGLDGIRLYNRVLSASEISELYQQELSFNPDLIQRYNTLPFTYSENVAAVAAIPSHTPGLVNANPDFIDLSNPIASHGLNDGLVSWWLAIPNQMGTTIWKDLCGRYDGILTNMDPGTDWLVDNEDGRWGDVNTNLASSEYINFSTINGADFQNGITMLFHGSWTLQGSGSGAVAVIGDSGFDNHDFGMLASSADTVRAWVRAADGTRVSCIMQAGNGPLDYWWVVADNSNLYAYKSSTLINSIAKNSGFDIEGEFAIGVSGARLSSYASTSTSTCLIWNRPLSLEERIAWENESRTYYPNLLNRIPSLLPVAVSEAAGGAYSLTVDSQSITVTGTDASLLYDRVLSVDSGSFTLTGTAATLNKGFTLVVDSQSITVTGTDTGVFYNRSLPVDSQSITVTGTNASTLFNRQVSVDSQSITVTGTDASTLYDRVIGAESGSVTLSGTAATLTVSSVGNYSISAEGKAIALTPTDASLLFNRQISTDSQSITVTGTDAGVFYDRVIVSDSGIISVTGTDASTVYDRVFSVDSDSLTITGTDASPLYNRSLSADGGSFTVSVSDASLLYDRVLSADSQSVTVVGTIATLQYSEDIGVYVYTATIALSSSNTAEISLTSSHTAEITVEIDG